MNNCNWEAIHGFNSSGEYQRFCSWLDAQISSGVAEQVSVASPSEDLIFGLEEKWFKCKASGDIWRLVSPEFPFRGLWNELSVPKPQFNDRA